MEIYLVGGAIRDELLGLPIKERDWVIVGSTPEELMSLGFQPVGKDFPVFLHPETHEEYALARTERKIGKGYKGFHFYATPNITLKEDLKRRDLTINAIAQSNSGELIDPYGGQEDLQQHWLRHISQAFAEDPVRILRVARFAAKLPNFTVFSETNHLMQKMVTKGEVDALVPERVWQELARALQEKAPVRFFNVLHQSNALSTLFPEIKMNGHGIIALVKATQQSQLGVIRFAALVHDINAKSVKALCQRVRAPREYTELALLAANHYQDFQQIDINHAKHLLKLLKSTDALRRPNRFEQFIKVCQACDNDKKNLDQTKKLLQNAASAIKSVDITPLLNNNIKGKEFADALHELHISAIEQMAAEK